MKEKVFKWNGVSGFYLLDAERYNADKRLYGDNFRPRYTDYIRYCFRKESEREQFIKDIKDSDTIEIVEVEVIYW